MGLVRTCLEDKHEEGGGEAQVKRRGSKERQQIQGPGRGSSHVPAYVPRGREGCRAVAANFKDGRSRVSSLAMTHRGPAHACAIISLSPACKLLFLSVSLAPNSGFNNRKSFVNSALPSNCYPAITSNRLCVNSQHFNNHARFDRYKTGSWSGWDR